MAERTEEHALKPCPFCGSKKVEFANMPGRGMFVYCMNCKASANIALRKKDAIYLWNKRAEVENDR